MESITVRYAFSWEEYKRANLYLFYRLSKRAVQLVLMSALGLVGAAFFAVFLLIVLPGSLGEILPVLYLWLLLPLIAVLTVVAQRRAVRKTWRRPASQEEFCATFTSDTVRIQSRSQELQQAWTVYQSYGESPEFFYLMLEKNRGVLIPKRAFDASSLEAFRSLIQQKLPPHKSLRMR